MVLNTCTEVFSMIGHRCARSFTIMGCNDRLQYNTPIKYSLCIIWVPLCVECGRRENTMAKSCSQSEVQKHGYSSDRFSLLSIAVKDEATIQGKYHNLRAWFYNSKTKHCLISLWIAQLTWLKNNQSLNSLHVTKRNRFFFV